MERLDYSSLMAKRINKILLICNNYDSYSLEEDGHIEAQIAQEYLDLKLSSNPPSITRVESTADAVDLLNSGERFDLVITMYNVGELGVFEFSHQFKALCPETPLVLLLSFSKEIYKMIEGSDRSDIDYIFCWNNNTDLIIAIIKLIEDNLNADKDISEFGVQSILLVEDSIRYYSTYLPLLYRLVLEQNYNSIKDTLNERQQTMRKRSRPKILMATNYDEAVELYDKYKSNILGVISDIGFVIHKGDASDTEKSDAGLELCRRIRTDNPNMPFMLQSSQESMRAEAEKLGVGFVLKNSKTLTHELAEYIGREFGFGDFVLVDPDTKEEVARAKNLNELEKIIASIPDDTLNSYLRRNYMSKWLLARGLFSLGKIIRPRTVQEFPDTAAHKKFLIDTIHDYRMNQALGVVAQFNPETYNSAIWFSRIGKGSMGGKARGLAFLNHMLQKYDLYDQWEDVHVLVPRTLVITTEYFDRFIIENGLQYVINSDISDDEVLSEFVASTLPHDLVEALRAFVRAVHRPLAVRSSSKLEDSYYQPFAGVYSTYMIPHTENEDQEIRLLQKAIKSVYASVFFASSKGYITSTGNVISEEKMAIVLQEICGSEDQGYYFPTLSGVARSLNFYPIGYEKPEEGIAKVAFGLGKAVVDGEQVLRFSPRYPDHVLQTSMPGSAMSETQSVMYALNLQPEKFKTSIDDAINLERIKIGDCAKFRNTRFVASTFDYQSGQLTTSPWAEGPKIITFAQILQYGTFPLADTLRTPLEISQDEVKCCVEIECAARLDVPNGKSKVFNVLQIRPISSENVGAVIDWDEIDTSSPLIFSESALGTGFIEGVTDVVYLRPENFDTLKTNEMALELNKLNAKMREEGRNYVLIGYGRWGSSIPSLGVPVKWSDISEAKVLVESGLENFYVEPSQGTHFFQNLTSFNVGYVNINPFVKEGSFDVEKLDSMPALEETHFMRHVRFDKPLTICIDGLKNKAIISE
ncbi:MAG: phosphoenolpyruvate synthase [Bacteroidales bacterium]|nr:phosphoenolpyruvate synthase [Bacteroidales bacterium]